MYCSPDAVSFFPCPSLTLNLALDLSHGHPWAQPNLDQLDQVNQVDQLEESNGQNLPGSYQLSLFPRIPAVFVRLYDLLNAMEAELERRASLSPRPCNTGT